MDPDSQHYAAIICEFGVYKPTVMLFELQNAPALFQRWMNYILQKLIATGQVFINILIATKDIENLLTEFFKPCRRMVYLYEKRNVNLKPKK